MYTTISDKRTIRESQKKMERILLTDTDREIDCFVGHKGESVSASISWSSELGIWMHFREISNRFWNLFGIDEPFEGENLSIICEINFPYQGINRRIAGAFAEDENRDLHIVHRGLIGGGREGIGKSLFMNEYRYNLIQLIDGDQINEVAYIGQLDDEDFASNIADFVKEVDRIKRTIYNP